MAPLLIVQSVLIVYQLLVMGYFGTYGGPFILLVMPIEIPVCLGLLWKSVAALRSQRHGLAAVLVLFGLPGVLALLGIVYVILTNLIARAA
ncbi:hypothetical protein [Hymenobacter sp. B81]|uniref:hypothetical protein n=1 Tax=Hymenobacter sp. B81 TaxID=3344878 RepID=UPI0037DC967F